MTDPRPDPGSVAAADQAGAGLATIAGMYGRYYRALREAGCPKRLARELVIDHHHLTMAGEDFGMEEDE